MVAWSWNSKTASVALAVGLSLSCKSALQTSQTQYIIGKSDIQVLTAAQLKDAVTRVSRSSTLLVTRLVSGQVKFCSGTVVHPEAGSLNLRVLTNHHCFAQVNPETELATSELLPEACVRTSVILGFSEATGYSTHTLGCKPGSLRTSHMADLAVFEITGQVPSEVTPIDIWPDQDVPRGKPAVIVHHPDLQETSRVLNGTSLRLPAAAVTRDDCTAHGKFSPSEEALDPVLALGVRHTCDLIKGSSGSALIDLASEQIIGVNWGGIIISGQGSERTDNVATEAKYVRAFLANSDLQKLLDEQIASRPKQQSNPRQEIQKKILGTRVSCGWLGQGSPAVQSIYGFIMVILGLALPGIGATLRRRSE